MLLRGGSSLYIVGYWPLQSCDEGVHGHKNPFTFRLTVVVLGLSTLIAGALAGRRPIRNLREVGAITDPAPCGSCRPTPWPWRSSG